MKKFILILITLVLLSLLVILWRSIIVQDNDEVIPVIVKEIEVTSGTVDIYELAQGIYGVPMNLLKAIETLETGNYSSQLFTEKNNSYGCKKSNGEWCGYDNHEQSIIDLARLLSFTHKVTLESVDLEAIQKTFCPNDTSWDEKVMEIWLELDKDILNY